MYQTNSNILFFPLIKVYLIDKRNYALELEDMNEKKTRWSTQNPPLFQRAYLNPIFDVPDEKAKEKGGGARQKRETFMSILKILNVGY